MLSGGGSGRRSAVAAFNEAVAKAARQLESGFGVVARGGDLHFPDRFRPLSAREYLERVNRIDQDQPWRWHGSRSAARRRLIAAQRERQGRRLAERRFLERA